MSDAKGAARLALLQFAGLALARRERGTMRAGTPLASARAPRLLLIRPDHLGDTLLATPAAHVLRTALPDAEIEWLVGPWAAEMAARAGGPAEVHSLEFPGFTRRPKSSPIQPYRLLVQEAARLRARHYDAVLILRPDHWWGAMLAAAAGIPRRFGYAVAECRPFLTDTLPPPTGHAVEANQSLARLAATAFGGRPSAETLSPAFAVSDVDAAWAAEVTSPVGDGRGPHPSTPSPCARERGSFPQDPRPKTHHPRIAVHPGSGAAIKSWPIPRWAVVVRDLRDQYDAEVILTGGPGERELVQQIAARLDPAPLVLAGETTLGQLAALFARCELVIGGDSGPLHLAAAVGTRTARLYGPTDTVEFGPWPPDDSQIALAAGLPCQPCRNLTSPPCGAVELPACLRAISPDAVTAAAVKLLSLPLSAPTRGSAEGEGMSAKPMFAPSMGRSSGKRGPGGEVSPGVSGSGCRVSGKPLPDALETEHGLGGSC